MDTDSALRELVAKAVEELRRQSISRGVQPGGWWQGYSEACHTTANMLSDILTAAGDQQPAKPGWETDWLLDLMGEWDRPLPTGMFNAIIEKMVAKAQPAPAGMVLVPRRAVAWVSDNDLLKLSTSVDDARNIRMSTIRSHLRVHPVYIPAIMDAIAPPPTLNEAFDQVGAAMMREVLGDAAPEGKCTCDGTTYAPDQGQPFLINRSCPKHGEQLPAAQVAELWCLHLQGPDEVHAAPSKEHVEQAIRMMEVSLVGPGAELVRPAAAIWPHNAASHAESVGTFIADWLIPRWQIDALASNTTAPAVVVDEAMTRKIITDTIGFDFEVDEFQTVNADDLLRLAAALKGDAS